jgi:hypothetical protein
MKAGVCRGILYAAGFRSRLSMLRLLSMGSRIGERIAQARRSLDARRSGIRGAAYGAESVTLPDRAKTS